MNQILNAIGIAIGVIIVLIAGTSTINGLLLLMLGLAIIGANIYFFLKRRRDERKAAEATNRAM